MEVDAESWDARLTRAKDVESERAARSRTEVWRHDSEARGQRLRERRPLSPSRYLVREEIVFDAWNDHDDCLTDRFMSPTLRKRQHSVFALSDAGRPFDYRVHPSAHSDRDLDVLGSIA